MSAFARYAYDTHEVFHQTNMSTVQRATKTSTPAQEQAPQNLVIKQARMNDGTDPEVKSEFNKQAIVNEAEWLGVRLQHPNIMRLDPIEERGSTSSQKSYLARADLPGQPWFIIMEMLDGSLHDFIGQQGKLGLHLALTLFREIADALAHVHAKGGIHRDIKAPNVLLRKKQKHGQLHPMITAVLSDFGLTVEIGNSVFCSGTTKWLAPEARKAKEKGKKLIAQPSLDLYPLGLLLYFMLTGVLPDANAVDYLHPTARITDASLADDPTIPAPLRRLLVEKVNDILAQLLQAEPGARPSASMIEKMVSALLTLIESHSAQPTPAQITAKRSFWTLITGLFTVKRAWSPQLGSLAVATLLISAVLWFFPPVVTGEGTRIPPTPSEVIVNATPTVTAEPAETLPSIVNVAVAITATLTGVATATPTVAPELTATSTAVTTATPTVTPEPTATSTAVVTATPMVTPELTATKTNTSTPAPAVTMAPTSTPVPTPTVTPTPTNTPRPLLRIPNVVLINPPHTSSDPAVPFTWQADGALAPNHCFQLVFWEAGGDPLRFNQSVVLTGADKRTAVKIKFAEAEQRGDIKSGVAYNVGVIVINCNPPYQRLRLASNVHVFTYHAP